MSTNEIEKIGKNERNEYYRNYRKKHKEEIKKTQEKYWQKKALEKQNSIQEVKSNEI